MLLKIYLDDVQTRAVKRGRALKWVFRNALEAVLEMSTCVRWRKQNIVYNEF